MHDQTGDLFLVREVDLESLPSSVLSLQIQVIINSLLRRSEEKEKKEETYLTNTIFHLSVNCVSV